MNRFLKKKKTIEENSIPSSSTNDEWKSLFKNISVIDDGLVQAREANNNLHARLSRVLEAFEKIGEQQGKIFIDLINILDYCRSLNPAPPEIEGIQAQILSILKDQGVSIWSPVIGEPMPEHCEAIAVKETSEYNAQTILEVISPGYLWGEKILLRRPRVVLSKLPIPEEVETQPVDGTTIPSRRRRRTTTRKEIKMEVDDSIKTEDRSTEIYQEDPKVSKEPTKKQEKKKE
ncbi:MAG: nucleotide exchange factor GrpE [Anaerolineaceae bacterium]